MTLDVHLESHGYLEALREDVRAGLTATPKSLPPKWLYDKRGSELFDEIPRLPEYYPTIREAEILAAHAADIVRASGADTLVELGSGTSEKTRLLLNAFEAAGSLTRFIPFDVDPTVLRAAGAAIAIEHPGVEVAAVVGDFTKHLGFIPRKGRRLIAFLGSTVGNFLPADRATFLKQVADALEPGEGFLLGTDLVKDAARLIAAYNDSAGVTAAFNSNILSVLNRELGADADLDAFDHDAFWDAENEWIDINLRSTRNQVVRVEALDLDVPFAAGERMRTEISAKFRRDGVAAELAAVGLTMTEWWTDTHADFGLSLSVRS